MNWKKEKPATEKKPKRRLKPGSKTPRDLQNRFKRKLTLNNSEFNSMQSTKRLKENAMQRSGVHSRSHRSLPVEDLLL